MDTIIDTIVKNKIDRTNQLADLVKSKVELKPGIFSIKDANGEILVSLNTGEVARRFPNGKLRQYATGDLSVKNNGYVYMSVFYKTESGKIKSYTVGQHTLICMIADPDNYKPGLVPCHKDACKWNNKASNIEWGTQQDNARHDKVVHKLKEVDPDKIEIKNNLSMTDFVCLREPLSISQINEIYNTLF